MIEPFVMIISLGSSAQLSPALARMLQTPKAWSTAPASALTLVLHSSHCTPASLMSRQ